MATVTDQDIENLKDLRRTILQIVFHAKEGHIPSAFSILEILYILYRDCLRFDPKAAKNSDDRDYFVLSKGHAGAGLYAVLAHFGFFTKNELMGYCRPGSRFGGHPDALKVPGVEVSTGSLGHGIAVAVGIAMGLHLRKSPRKAVVLVGDGEMDEGSFWESVMMIRSLGLDNIIIIADCNRSQKYAHQFDYVRILEGFDWKTSSVDGHDLRALSDQLRALIQTQGSGPAFVVAHTEKGHGIQRFVGDHGWHRRTPTTDEMTEFLRELM